VHWRDLLERLPADFPKPAGLVVSSVGGRLAPHLGERIRERLANRVIEHYGSNELGPVSERVEDGSTSIGFVHPGVEVEVVDRYDHPLPTGKPGQIRVRSAYVVEAYLDDSETTARMFRDGWFYPGDLGILHEPGRLEVVGRDDEILNLGGLKILPEEVEDMVHQRAAVSDVGVCAIPNADGIDEVWVAVVYDAPDDRDIRARLEPAFVAFPFGDVHLFKVARIPRTETGKVRRALLKDLVMAAKPQDGTPRR
jgi:acyl-coenzyme A synthetase/AMP-(fatty) acid ligase